MKNWENEWDRKFSKSLEKPLAWQGDKVLTTENKEAKYFINRLLQDNNLKVKRLNIDNNILKQKIENIKRICYLK